MTDEGYMNMNMNKVLNLIEFVYWN